MREDVQGPAALGMRTCEQEGVKPRALYLPIRVAITGRTVAPGLYESLELLGREESLRRIEDALGRLAA